MKRLNQFLALGLAGSVLVIGLLLGIFHAVTRPPDRAEMEKLEARDRELVSQLTAAARRRGAVSAASRTAGGRTSATALPEVDFPAEVGRLNMESSEMMRQGEWPQSLFLFETRDSGIRCRQVLETRVGRDQPVLDAPIDGLWAGTPGRMTTPRKIMQDPSLWGGISAKSDYYALLNYQNQSQQTPGAERVATARFGALLDKTQRLMLETAWRADPASLISSDGLNSGFPFYWLVDLAMMRALARGDDSLALRLLLRQLDSLPMTQLSGGADRLDQPLNRALFSVLLYRALAKNPSDCLAPAMERIAALRLDPARMVAEYNALRQLRFAEEMKHLPERIRRETRSNIAYVPWFVNWGIESTISRFKIAAIPSLKALHDQAYVAYCRRDRVSKDRAMRRMEVMGSMLSLPRGIPEFLGDDPASAGLTSHAEWDRLLGNAAELRIENANAQLEIVLRLLAIEGFRDRHGRPPRTIGELDAEWPAPVLAPPCQWEMLELAAFQFPLTGSSGKMDDFDKAVERFHKEHQRAYPADLRDLEPYFPAGIDRARFRDRFKTYPARMVIVRMSTVRNDKAAFEKIYKARAGRFDTPPTPAERAQLQGQDPSGGRLVYIDDACLADMPSMKELKALLLAPPSTKTAP